MTSQKNHWHCHSVKSVSHNSINSVTAAGKQLVLTRFGLTATLQLSINDIRRFLEF